jgi:hypothetical protein
VIVVAPKSKSGFNSKPQIRNAEKIEMLQKQKRISHLEILTMLQLVILREIHLKPRYGLCCPLEGLMIHPLTGGGFQDCPWEMRLSAKFLNIFMQIRAVTHNGEHECKCRFYLNWVFEWGNTHPD